MKKLYNTSSKMLDARCRWCGSNLISHPICERCEILLHDMDIKCACGSAHMGSLDGDLCLWCTLWEHENGDDNKDDSADNC